MSLHLQSTQSQRTLEAIKLKATQALKWAYLGSIAPRLIGPAINIALARILVPTDYGIFGVATLVISFSNIFQEMGLSRAVIQRQTDVPKAADVAFWSNLTFSLIIYALLFGGAPLIGAFFNNPRVIPVIRVVGAQIVINALGAVQSALLQRDFRFRDTFWAQLLPALVPLAVALPLALKGYGYWALIWSILAASALRSGILWIRSPWRPVLRFDLGIAKQMFVFGIWLVIESIGGWALHYGDNTVVGRLLGMQRLGFYALGFNLVLLVTGFALNPLSSLAYSAFSRLQNDKERLRSIYIRVTSLIGFICLPIGIGLAIIAKPLVLMVFGSKWQGLEVVISILAIMPGLSYLWLLNPEIYKAIGRPDIMPKVQLATILYIVPVFLLSAPLGLLAFCLARMSVGFVFAPVHTIIAIKVLGLPKAYLWHCVKAPLLAAISMAIAVYPMSLLLSPYDALVGWIKLGSLVFLGVIIYLAVIWTVDRNLIYSFVRMVRRSVKTA